MSAISQRIDAIVRQALDQPLKERGFERQGRSFRRAEGGGRIAVLRHFPHTNHFNQKKNYFTPKLPKQGYFIS